MSVMIYGELIWEKPHCAMVVHQQLGREKLEFGRNQTMNGRNCPGATLRILLRLQLHPQRGILHPQSLVCTPNVFTLQGWQ